MKPLDPISRIMTSNIVKLNVDDQLTKAEELFKRNKIRHIPVVKGNSLVGMLSYTDLQRISFIDDLDFESGDAKGTVYNMFTLEQVMSKQVISVLPWTPIKEVAHILSESNFHALPVVQEDNLVGIVSTVDVLKYFVSQFDK